MPRIFSFNDFIMRRKEVLSPLLLEPLYRGNSFIVRPNSYIEKVSKIFIHSSIRISRLTFSLRKLLKKINLFFSILKCKSYFYLFPMKLRFFLKKKGNFLLHFLFNFIMFKLSIQKRISFCIDFFLRNIYTKRNLLNVV